MTLVGDVHQVSVVDGGGAPALSLCALFVCDQCVPFSASPNPEPNVGRFGTAVLCAHIASLAVNPWAARADLWAVVRVCDWPRDDT
jgi:hypothetical protein